MINLKSSRCNSYLKTDKWVPLPSCFLLSAQLQSDRLEAEWFNENVGGLWQINRWEVYANHANNEDVAKQKVQWAKQWLCEIERLYILGFFFLQSFAKQHRPRLIFHVFAFGIELCLKNNNSMVFSLDNHGHIKKNEIIKRSLRKALTHCSPRCGRRFSCTETHTSIPWRTNERGLGRKEKNTYSFKLRFFFLNEFRRHVLKSPLGQ